MSEPTTSDEQLLAAARNHALEGLLMCVAIKDSPRLQPVLMRYFQNVVTAIEVDSQQKASPVTPEVLAEDVINACYLEGWDTSATFWPGGRYDEDDEEIPSEEATNIARRLLEHYEMKPRT